MKQQPLILAGKKVAVLGAGRTGIAVSRFCASRKALVLLSDKNKKPSHFPALPSAIETEFGAHSNNLLSCDLVIKSPGIPYTIPIIKKAFDRSIPVWDELELASHFLDPRKVIAVTGTNGKTTTATLIDIINKKAGLNSIACGNIGRPVSTVLNTLHRYDVIVMEVSSYQLEKQQSFHPRIAAILNLTPDHLSRHQNMSQYRQAKEKIFRNQTSHDFCIFNYEDNNCRIMARLCPAKVIFFSSKRALKKGLYYDSDGFHYRFDSASITLKPQWELPGIHNIENALTAIGAAILFGISRKAATDALSSFHGVAHRLEFIATINDVTYINDSKSTNVDSTMVALNSFADPLWLILGGRDKGSPYRPLKPLIKQHVKRVLLIGEATSLIERDLKGTVPLIHCRTMNRAVAYSRRHAQRGDTVLLSPACASFDQYQNFEQRGEHFRSLVHNVKKKIS